MRPEVYGTLLRCLRRHLAKRHTNFRRPISAETRLAVTLRYLALGDGFRSISQQFRIGLSTARLIVFETCCIVARVMQHRYLRTPRTRQEWLRIASTFERRWDLMHCIGAVDGKHVRIVQPPRSGSYYYNYKGYYSIVLLAVSDASYRFVYVDIGAEGKASDGGTWLQSTFYQYLTSPQNPLDIPVPEYIDEVQCHVPYFLVGDDAFRMSPNLLKPFPGSSLTRKERIFNYRLCRARRIVENTFGIMTTRFKIFRRTIEVAPKFAEAIILASCILHNFLAEEGKAEYLPTRAIDHEVYDGQVVPGQWRHDMARMDNLQRDTQ